MLQASTNSFSECWMRWICSGEIYTDGFYPGVYYLNLCKKIKYRIWTFAESEHSQSLDEVADVEEIG